MLLLDLCTPCNQKCYLYSQAASKRMQHILHFITRFLKSCWFTKMKLNLDLCKSDETSTNVQAEFTAD